MKFSPPIFNINLLTRFCIFGDFSVGYYAQTDCNFNFNINVTVDSYMNSSFNFSFSHLVKYLLVFGLWSKITPKFDTIPRCLLFFLLNLLYIFEKQAWHEAYIFFNCFWLALLTHWFLLPLCTFINLKSLQSNSIFYIRFHLHLQWISFYSSLSCKLYTVSKFKRINNKSFYCLYFRVTSVWIQDLFIIIIILVKWMECL